MAITLEQRHARMDEDLARVKGRIASLHKQASAIERRERSHRLIVAASTIEAEAKKHGLAGFEVDEELAGKMARFWFEEHDGLERRAQGGEEIPIAVFSDVEGGSEGDGADSQNEKKLTPAPVAGGSDRGGGTAVSQPMLRMHA